MNLNLRNIVMGVFLTSMIFSHAAVYAEEANKSGEISDVLHEGKDLTAVKNTKEDIEKANERIVQAKEELEKEKKELSKSGADDLVKEKLETIEKKAELIQTAESFVENKIKAHESITRLIERKLEFLDNRKMPAEAFEEEINFIDAQVQKLNKEKQKIQSNLERNDQAMSSLKKHISSHKLLMELKGEEDPALRQTHQAVQERLQAAEQKKILFEEQIKITELQKEIAQDYLSSLRFVRWERLREELLISKRLNFSVKEGFALGLIFLILAFAVFTRKRVKTFFKNSHYFGSKKIAFFYSKIIFILWLIFGAYLIAALLGFHVMARYVGGRFLDLFILGLAFVAGYKLLKGAVRRFVFKDTKDDLEEEKTQSTISHPYFEVFLILTSWTLFFTFLYFVLQTLELQRDGLDLAISILNYPMATIGEVAISTKRILIFIFIVWFSVFASRLIANFLSKAIYPKMGIEESIQYTISVAIKYFMVICGTFVGLQILGVKMTALTVFAGTVGIGIGFGLQDIAKNFISGLIILIERPIKIGDYIEVGELPGRVKAIKARSTIVDTFDNISVVVPNSEFMSQRIVNWSHSDRIIRVQVPVGVAYGSDIDLVKKILLDVSVKHQKVLKRPAPSVWFEEFGDSSLNFKLFVWTREPENRFGLRSDLNAMIDSEFRKHHVTIPFPQRDLHFKTSNISLNPEANKKDQGA